MFFNSKAKREEQERRQREYEAKRKELEEKEIRKYYELYKNDEGVLNLVRNFFYQEHRTGFGRPKEWLLWSADDLSAYVDSNKGKTQLNAYVQVDQESITFRYMQYWDTSHIRDSYHFKLLYKECGFANIEDPNKQKAILLVFADYFKKEAQSIYSSKGLTNVNMTFELVKVYNYRESIYSDYDIVGVADEQFYKRKYAADMEHERNPAKSVINAKILDGAVITVTNNQPNVLRQL